MATGVQELKRTARMQEWSVRIAECRSSGMGVKAWCKSQGIAATTYYHWEKRFIMETTQQLGLPAPTRAGLLIRVNPENMPENVAANPCVCITIRHGESVITLPAGSSAEAVADLVKALNRHA